MRQRPGVKFQAEAGPQDVLLEPFLFPVKKSVLQLLCQGGNRPGFRPGNVNFQLIGCPWAGFHRPRVLSASSSGP